MLSNDVMSTIKSTIPLLESAGPAITEHFYKRLFSHHPELQNIFNMSNQQSGRQQFALFSAIAAYAKNIDNLDALKEAVERIANKHTSLNVQAEHYPIVGHHLIETLRELAGPAFTQEVEDAWTHAYGFLADIFVARESELYRDSEVNKGGWKGARKFRLIEKRIESELVKSLVFEPLDNLSVLGYKPGQYIGIRVKPAASEFDEIRQYSLSGAANGSTYQISVKREPGQDNTQAGVVSNYLHDELRLGQEVELFAPAGDFFFINKQKPVALVSAGVGLTPMNAILETLKECDYEQPIHYLHACENIGQHSFRKQVKAHSGELRIKHHTWYANGHNETEDSCYDGYMDLSKIKEQLPLADADFYMCGPIPFMKAAKQQLVELGVNNDRIHYEVFGPHDNL